MRNTRQLSLLFLTLIQLVLVGCAVEPTTPKLPDIATPEQELTRLYQLAKQSRSPDSEKYRLHAVKLLLELNHYAEARKIFTYIPARNLPDSLTTDYALTGAELANAEFDGQQALRLLTQYKTAISSAGDEATIRAAELKAQAYNILTMPIAGAEQLIRIAPLLTDAATRENKELLWQLLMQGSADNLWQKLSEINNRPIQEDTDLKGWLQLALIAKNNQYDIDRQLIMLKQWQQDWPTHPATRNLPEELKLLSTIVTERPQRITLMLPLSGTNAMAGRAIRDGFLSAYYQTHAKGIQTPDITVLDTGDGDFAELYDKAVIQGTELIIGPLQKKHVQSLVSRQDLAIPTLALNYGNTVGRVGNLYQFGLSAEDEAKQAAERAWQDGHRNALVLLPDSDWGRRIAAAFEQEWLALAGTLLETQFFSEEKSYSNAIQELLNINESSRRAKRIQSFTTTKIEFTPRRRADMDFIFVAASPKQARQIKPTLAFHFAGRIPVYATSHIFSGTNSPLLDRDLDRVIFCETPWMLNTANNPLKRQIRQLWPATADRLGRLYALGIDAYRLYPRLKQLSLIRNTRLDGMTGSLSLNSEGRIIRTLPWARFTSGRVKIIH